VIERSPKRPDSALRRLVACLFVGCACAALSLAAPLHASGGDTVPGRFGAAVFACRSTFDLREVDWIAADDAADSLPYYAARGREGAVLSILGPVPAALGAPFMEGLEEGTVLMDRELERRARIAATLAVSVAALLLTAALTARTTALRAAVLALVVGLSFAGVPTLAQGLWQQTALVVPMMAAVATLAWAPWRGGALLVFTPALLSVAVLTRPNAVFVLGALGIVWILAVRSMPRWRALFAMALPVAALGALPQLAWNMVATGDPLALHVYVPSHRAGGILFHSDLGAFVKGLAGLVASPARGLLFFAPVFPLSLYVSLRYGDREARLVGAGILLHIAVIAAYRAWWGGWVFGPRLLSEAVWLSPLLVAAMPPSRALRTLFLGASVATVAVGILGTFRYDAGVWELRRDPDKHQDALWDFRDSPLVAMIHGHGVPTVDAPPGPYAYCTRRALDRVARVSP
jgi:hypothetical protein